MHSVLGPLLLNKPASAGNRTRDLWIFSQELWPLDLLVINTFLILCCNVVLDHQSGLFSSGFPIKTYLIDAFSALLEVANFTTYFTLLYYQISNKVPGLSKSSRTRSKKKFWLNLLDFGCYLLPNSLLGNVCSDPIAFSTLQKHRGSHFPWCCRVPLAIPFARKTVSKRRPFSFTFNLEEKRNHRGLSPASREDWER
jgi:hypothetical protein